MIDLSEYVRNIITEHKADLMPKCIIMTGGPGAGKTTWMNNDAKKFFPEMKQYKKLDSDHNLEGVQRDNEKEIAIHILHICSKNWPDDRKRKEFNKYIESKQLGMDAVCDQNGSPKVNLSLIDFGFCNEKGIELTKVSHDKRERFESQFVIDFHNKYWKKIFASDFSNRPISKREYKDTYYKKLSNCTKKDVDTLGVEEAFLKTVDGGEFDGKSDIVLAICGDEINDFKKPVELCNGRYAIYVIYLDVPLELSIARDAKRDRSVGADKCKEKLDGCKGTWERLKKQYEDLGIWQMYRFEWHDDIKKTVSVKSKIKGAQPEKKELRGGWGDPVESFTNQKMLKGK